MAISSWNEVFSEGEEITTKIKELPEKYGINLPEEALKKYGEHVISQAEIEKLRIKTTAWEKLDTLKWLFWLKAEIDISGVEQQAEALKRAKISAEAEARSSGEIAQKAMDSLQWNEVWKKSKEMLSWSLDTASKLAAKAWNSEIAQKTKKAVEKAKDWSFSMLSNLNWKALEELPLIWWLIKGIISAFNSIKSFLHLDKAEKAREAAEKILSPEEVEKTKGEMEKQVSVLLTEIWISADKKEYILGKLDPSKEWAYISKEQFQVISEKIKKWQKIDLKDLNILWSMLKDPVMKETAIEILDKSKKEITKKLKKYLEKQYHVTIDESKKEAFRNLVENDLLNNTKAKEVLANWRLYLLSDTISLFNEKIIGFSAFVWGCFNKWIIWIDNILIEAASTSWNMIKIWLKSLSWNDVYWSFAESLWWEDFQDKLKEMPSEKKVILLKLFYAKWQLVSQLLWWIWWAITSWIVSWVEKATWWKNVSSVFKNTESAIWKLWETLEILKPWESKWLIEMWWALSDSEKSYKILQEIEKAWWNATPKQKLELERIKNKLSWLVDNYKLWSNKFIEWLKWNPIKLYYFKKHIKQLSNFANINYNIWIKTSWGLKLSRQKDILRKYRWVFELREISANTVMHISDNAKWKEMLKAMWRMSPEIVRWLFAWLPILAVWTTLYSEMISSKWKWEWWEVFKMLSWLPGGLMIMDEAFVDWKWWDFKVENWDKFIAWSAIVSIEWLIVWKETIKYYKSMNLARAFWKAIFNSTIRLPMDAIKFWWFIWKTSMEWIKTAIAIAKTWEKIWWRIPSYWRLVWVWFTVLLAAAIWIDKLTSDKITIEEQIDILKKEGFIAENWEWNYDKIWQSFTNLDEEKKKEILTIIALSGLSQSEDKITSDNIGFDYSWNKFTITDKWNILNPEIKDSVELELASFMNEIWNNSQIIFA